MTSTTRLDHVPVIDIQHFIVGSPAQRDAVARQVQTACEQVGFLVVTGHRVERGTVDDLYREAHAFFRLPDAEKQEVLKPAGTNPRGYSPMGLKTVGKDRNPGLKPSLFESFAIGPADDGIGNKWPVRRGAFKAAFLAYYAAMEQLSGTILDIFSHSLDVPPSYFRNSVRRHMSILRANHYPPLQAVPGSGEERAAAHTDATAITILKVDDAPGGLQVQLPGGAWVDVPKVENAFVVNIGDILMRWTNDRYLSTMHRVVNPPAELAATADRLSVPYFCIPDYDAVVECIPSCVGSGAKYPAITTGELLTRRYAVTYSLADRDAAPVETQ